MRFHHRVIVLFLSASPSLIACSSGQDSRANATLAPSAHQQPVLQPTSQSLLRTDQATATPESANPMAHFAGLIGDEWRVILTNATSATQEWHWGPGRHSVRKMAEGSHSIRNPWAAEVLYWHPGRKHIRVLSMHGEIPGIGRGVGEGSIAFDGTIADGLLDLEQPPGRRTLGMRWVFDGPDMYHDTLLESTGPEGFQTLAEWDIVRVKRGAENGTFRAHG